MKFLDLLRKLGILRFGFKKTNYNGSKDRPIEFMADNVYNSKKDIMFQKKETLKNNK